MTATILDAKIEELRAHLPAVHTHGYFNAGTNGPIPYVAQKELIAAMSAEVEEGRIAPGKYERPMDDSKLTRSLIAQLIGALPSEVAITRSTVEGLNIVLSGLRWIPGDEILTTNLEHPGLFNPMLLAGSRSGVISRVVDIGNGDGYIVDKIERAITRRTRVIALSHLQWSTGAIMPLEKISELAHNRDILVFVDGAQSAGQIPIDVKLFGVDAYALPGQKWLCGPTGTGALYVSPNRLADIQPTFIRGCASSDLAGNAIVPSPGAARYEFGDSFNPMIRAWNATLTWLQDEVGHDWMYDRIHELGQRFHRGISGIKGVNILTPRDNMGGIVNFTIDGISVQDASNAIYERGHIVRSVVAPPSPQSVRVSNGWWNTGAEVDSLVDAIAVISRAARSN